MSPDTPRVSFGLPVKNGAQTLRHCLDSILAQDFTDFEVVISDNASTDDTRAVIEEYAARDPRIRPFFNPEDLGQIENFNGVFRLASGEYFRWIGCEDWIESDYLGRCVAALEQDPGAIAVTTFFLIHKGGALTKYEEYDGELLESSRPERRFARMVWTFHAGAPRYDPIYSLIRSEALARTNLIRMMTKADHMLAAELSLLGRFHHIPVCLAHRRKPETFSSHKMSTLRRYRPTSAKELDASPWRLFRVLASIPLAAPLDPWQKARCLWAALIYFLEEARNRSRRAATRFRRGRLGITRQRLSERLPPARRLGGRGP